MTTLQKLRILFAISIVLLIIFRIIIPGYQEIKREGKITDKDIQEYRNNSTIVKIPNYERLPQDERTEIYFDGTPFVKKGGRKEFTIIKDISKGKFFKIELYHPQSLMTIRPNRDNLWLKVNNDELKSKRGTLNEPFIALRYGLGTDENNYVPQAEYDYNVKEYLTYRNYTPPSKDFIYYLTMIWTFVTIAGFSITTGLSIRKERAEKQAAESAVIKDLEK